MKNQLPVHRGLSLPEAPQAAPQPLRVLAMEDDMLFHLILKRLITNSGVLADVVFCENGFTGLEHLTNLLVEGNTSQYPDIILLDLHMPRLSGSDFLDSYARYFRHQFTDTTIYVLSGSSFDYELKHLYQRFPFLGEPLRKPLNNDQWQSIARRHQPSHPIPLNADNAPMAWSGAAAS
ncbi:MAG: response regulator [Bacteroidota bacterium]